MLHSSGNHLSKARYGGWPDTRPNSESVMRTADAVRAGPRVAARMLLVGAALLGASGCSGESGDAGVIKSGDSFVLVAPKGYGDNMVAVGLFGVVGPVGNCLGIEGATVFWPHGTKVVSEEPLVIDVPKLGEIQQGDRVSGGGDSYSSLPEFIDEIPSGCSTEKIWVFYPDDTQ